MEILIKLDKRLYEYAKHHTLTSGEIDEMCDVIANGTPLPKGHGNLVDYDELKSNAGEYSVYAEVILSHAKPKTIIGADKTESEE